MGRIKDTPGQYTAKLDLAKRRQCPACGRKSALKREWSGWPNEGRGGHVTYCRWCSWSRGGVEP